MIEFRFLELFHPSERTSALLCLEHRVRESLMELKVFGIGLCWCFIGWKYTSVSKTILLWTDTGILCHLMGLLYYLLYKKKRRPWNCSAKSSSQSHLKVSNFYSFLAFLDWTNYITSESMFYEDLSTSSRWKIEDTVFFC